MYNPVLLSHYHQLVKRLSFMVKRKAPVLKDAWITVVDPVLNPVAPHSISRHYLIWDGREGPEAPLVVAFHGGHGSAEVMANDYLIPRGGYVVAYPSGSNKGPFASSPIRVSGDNLSWNTSSPYEVGQGWAGEAGVNDDLFITTLVTALKAQFNCNKAFVVGVSRGGMMAFHYACTTNLFSAMATVATTILDPLPVTRIPDIHVHGTADPQVCWDVWQDSCAPWPKAKPLVSSWQASGSHELHVIPNGVHAWSPNGVFDTTGAIWNFLSNK